MAILNRRSLQGLLDDLSVPQDQSEALVTRLNLGGKQALEAEWELIVLTALSHIGFVEYEPRLGGSGSLDIRFDDSGALQFTGEITAISDDESSRRNPVDHLTREIMHRLEKRGIQGGVTISVGSKREGDAISLILPSPHKFSHEIFGREFYEFLDSVSRAPTALHTFRVHSDTSQVSISYAPGHPRIIVHHVPFKWPRDIVKNALYNRLKKKVEQIKRAGPRPADRLYGIIVCDCKCELLQGKGNGSISFESVARHFLKKSTSLHFVVGLSVKSGYAWDGRARPYEFDVVVVDPLRDRGELIAAAFEKGLQQLPQPVRSASAARVYLEGQQKQGLATLQYRDRSAPEMADGQIRLSARAVIDYLTGRIDRQHFEILADDWMLGILRRELEAGAIVSSVQLHRSERSDDDILEIQWRNHDPAVSPFESALPRP